MTHDGYLLRFVERAELPVEEVDDTIRFRDDKCVRCRLSGRCGGVLPAKEGGLAVLDIGGEEGIGALILYIGQVGKCEWAGLGRPVTTAILQLKYAPHGQIKFFDEKAGGCAAERT